MKVKLDAEIRAFDVPAHVIMVLPNALQTVPVPWTGSTPPSAPPHPVNIPLQMLDAATLDKLCDDLRDEVFSRAGKLPPPDAYYTAAPAWPKDAFELLKNDIWCKKGFASPRHFEEGQIEDLSSAIEQIEAYFKAL